MALQPNPNLDNNKDKDKENEKAVEKALEEQRKKVEEQQKEIERKKFRSRYNVIKRRITQQFQSPNSTVRGVVTSPEEQRMIEDQTKMILRKERKQAQPKEEVAQTQARPNSSDKIIDEIIKE